MTEQPVETPAEERTDGSPPWNMTTKTIVALIGLALLVLVAFRFQDLLQQIVAAAIIAYVLNPIVVQLEKRTRLKRGLAILIIYLVGAISCILIIVGFGTSAYGQIRNFIEQVPGIVRAVIDWLQITESLAAGPFTINIATIRDSIDWTSVQQELLGLVDPVVRQSGSLLLRFANSSLQLVTSVIFTFIISIYLAFELPLLGSHFGNLIQPSGYRRDAERLMRESGRIWRAYLRGQIFLAVVIGGAVWIGLALLGVQNSFALGVLSGLLEFLPVVGPLIGALAAVMVGLFQPENYLGFSPAAFTIAILVVMLIIQQIENNILVPRIIGDALDLHPLLVIIGVFVGTSLAGIVGAVLAAPVLATLKLFGFYAWRKSFDLPPFTEPEVQVEAKGPTLIERVKAVSGKLRR
jgi:predicted PurR-regulated permease PerM